MALKKLKKHGFNFLQAQKKSSNSMDFFFASLKKLKKHGFNFLKALKKTQKHGFNFLQA